MAHRLFLGVTLTIGLSTAVTAVSNAAFAGEPRVFASSDCRFEKPRSWTNQSIVWIGRCHSGYAYGLGVLRATGSKVPPELFVGRLDEGHLRSGVEVTVGGYIAGRWRNGSIIATGNDQADRNDIITAFDDAAAAATATGRTMKRRSDLGASRYYQSLASRLRDQMD